jgi:hypothetical protein
MQNDEALRKLSTPESEFQINNFVEKCAKLTSRSKPPRMNMAKRRTSNWDLALSAAAGGRALLFVARAGAVTSQEISRNVGKIEQMPFSVAANLWGKPNFQLWK